MGKLTEAIRIGTCQLCGEPQVELFRGVDLPEEFEGTGCAKCCGYFAAEAERQAERDLEKRLHYFDEGAFDA